MGGQGGPVTRVQQWQASAAASARKAPPARRAREWTRTWASAFVLPPLELMTAAIWANRTILVSCTVTPRVCTEGWDGAAGAFETGQRKGYKGRGVPATACPAALLPTFHRQHHPAHPCHVVGARAPALRLAQRHQLAAVKAASGGVELKGAVAPAHRRAACRLKQHAIPRDKAGVVAVGRLPLALVRRVVPTGRREGAGMRADRQERVGGMCRRCRHWQTLPPLCPPAPCKPAFKRTQTQA